MKKYTMAIFAIAVALALSITAVAGTTAVPAAPPMTALGFVGVITIWNSDDGAITCAYSFAVTPETALFNSAALTTSPPGTVSIQIAASPPTAEVFGAARDAVIDRATANLPNASPPEIAAIAAMVNTGSKNTNANTPITATVNFQGATAITVPIASTFTAANTGPPQALNTQSASG